MNLQDEIDKIDSTESSLFPTEKIGFAQSKDKCTSYLREGKDREAEGGVAVLKIMYDAAMTDAPVESWWGDL